MAPKATLTPIPAFAPVDSPDDEELDTALALVLPLALAVAVAVAAAPTTIVAILTPAALLTPQAP